MRAAHHQLCPWRDADGALFAAFFMHKLMGLDPYLAVFILMPAFFAFGYGLQRFIIARRAWQR